MQNVSRGECVRVNCTVVVVVVALAILCLSAGRSQGASISGRSEAYAKAQAAKKSGSSNGVSSYFRRDPYGPNTYAFGFQVNDKHTGNVQFRDERRYVNGSVEGSYGYVRPDGRVIVTHFLADDERGYSAKTFVVDERQEWQAHWPTKRPDMLMQRPPDLATGDVVFDKDLRLNVTNSKVPDAVADAVQQQHGVDVNKVDLQTDVIDPTVLNIINGKLPLQKPSADKGTFGFETVDNFIPPDFPIVPFQLPEQNEANVSAGVDAGSSTTEQSQGQKQQLQQQEQEQDKYNKAKMNNAEKSIDAAVLRKSDGGAKAEPEAKENTAKTTTTTRSSSRTGTADADRPKSLTAGSESAAGRQAWYEKIIDDTRNEFLQNLPDLA